MASTSSPEKIEEARREVDRVFAQAGNANEFMDDITRLLHSKILKYNWVGFYMLEPGTTPPVLVLGHFQGAMTPHVRIPLNQGICGAAASSGRTVVVDDVNSDPRYLACSLDTKSEIVVPIFSGGRVVGEIDIDSDQPAAFTEGDRRLVEHAASLLGGRWI